MQLTFTYGPDKLLLNQPLSPNGVLALKENNAAMAADWGILRIKASWFSDACLLLCNYVLDAPCTLHLQCPDFCWMMTFVIEGGFYAQNATGKMHLSKGNYHAGYAGELSMQLTIKENTKVLSICLAADFIKKLPGNLLLAQEFEDGITGRFSNGRFHILLNEILQAKQSPFIKHFFFEAKVLELLSLQLELLERKRQIPEVLPAEDISRLQRAREILANDLKTPCSLMQLAHKCGLNDFKLKMGFKLLFGTTVFGYLAELRMKQAYQLLTDGASVGLAAHEVGYKNPQHFTSAFKKRYGILPSQV